MYSLLEVQVQIEQLWTVHFDYKTTVAAETNWDNNIAISES